MLDVGDKIVMTSVGVNLFREEILFLRMRTLQKLRTSHI